RAFGVDLTAIPGVGPTTAQVVLTEGGDLTKFDNTSSFVNWVGVCPNNNITGGKVQNVHIGFGSNRIKVSLRLAAQTVEHMDNGLGRFFRKMKSSIGRPGAITAVAHKIGRIMYAMVTKGEEYDESRFIDNDQRQKQRRESKIRKQAKELGFDLVPREA